MEFLHEEKSSLLKTVEHRAIDHANFICAAINSFSSKDEAFSHIATDASSKIRKTLSHTLLVTELRN